MYVCHSINLYRTTGWQCHGSALLTAAIFKASTNLTELTTKPNLFTNYLDQPNPEITSKIQYFNKLINLLMK